MSKLSTKFAQKEKETRNKGGAKWIFKGVRETFRTGNIH